MHSFKECVLPDSQQTCSNSAPAWWLLVSKSIDRQEGANIQRLELCSGKAAVVALAVPDSSRAACKGRTPVAYCGQRGIVE